MSRIIASLVLILLTTTVASPQDSVAIPKSRLEELERKEAELEKLKGNLSKTRDENQQLKKQHEEDAVKIKSAPAPQPQPAIVHTSPPMTSLPPLAKGEMVDAMDLAGHYRADALAADQRYRKRTFKVQGEITGFEKPMFVRDYKVLLKTADLQTRVICDVYPPEKYKAVFPAKDGAELVALLPDESRVILLKAGERVVLEGQCRGLSGSVVRMTSCAVAPAP
jgi:hypothetical protein